MRKGKARMSLSALSLLTVFLITSLQGCGPFPSAVTPSASSVATTAETAETSGSAAGKILSFRITWKTYSGRGEAIRKIADTFNHTTDTGYTISLVDGDEDFVKNEALLAGEGAGDLFMLPYRYVKYFGNKGLLVDLSGDLGSERDHYYPQLWTLGTVGGSVYGIPWLGHSICLLYNKDLLEKAGVDGTKIGSMDDLLAAIDAVEAKTTAKGIGLVGADHNDISWMVNQFVYGYGASLVTPAGDKVAVNSPAAKEAILFYRDVLGPHAQPSWKTDTGVEVMSAFLNGKVAFEFQGPWGITDISKNGNPFQVGVMGVKSLGLKAEVGPMMLAVPTGLTGEKKAVALSFIRYLVSKEAQEHIMDGEYSPEHDAWYPFRIPARRDLADSLVFQQHPAFIPFLEGFENPSVDVPVPQWQPIKEQWYDPGLHRVMLGELDIDEFLTQVETEGNLLLKPSGN